MDKFRNKYRIPSARLQSWDYRWPGAYFITICTGNRVHYFGEIEPVSTGQPPLQPPPQQSRQMELSHIGIIADVLWHQIPNHSHNTELGAFVVMPNHIHGILILTGKGDNNIGEDHANNVETGTALSLRRKQPKTIGQQRFQNMGKNSVSSIIGSYKSAVTKHAHR